MPARDSQTMPSLIGLPDQRQGRRDPVGRLVVFMASSRWSQSHHTASSIASVSEGASDTPAWSEAIAEAPFPPEGGLQRRNRHPASSTVSNAALAIDATCIVGRPVAVSMTVIG
jgi:hypothetical protein